MHEFNLLIWLGEKISLMSWINEHNVHVASAGVVAIVILILGLIVRIKMRNPEKYIIPSKRLGIVWVFDAASEALLNLMEGIIGNHAIKYLPLIGSLFIYIFFCNLLSVIPGFAPPTDNINTNLPCALTVFLYYNYMGVKEHGFVNYFKHFAGPVLWLAPLMFTVELISHCVRPISLSVRLFGNIMGDHVVLGIFSHLVPLVVPVIFLFLALFVAFIQAFVFSLLSTVYIALATGHEEKT